jgi:tetratricopeptide (TPR) repeat protein
VDYKLPIAYRFEKERPDLGEVYLDMARYPDAIERFERALQLRPEIPDTHHSLGLAYLKSGNTAAALLQCELLRTLDSSKENDLRQQIAQFQVG